MLRLRGGPGADEADGSSAAKSKPTGQSEQYESLDAGQISGLAETVVYHVEDPVTIGSGENASVQVMTVKVKGQRVLVYDYTENQVNAAKAVHIWNEDITSATSSTNPVLAPGTMTILREHKQETSKRRNEDR